MNNESIQGLLKRIDNLEIELCSAISKIENLQRSEFKLEEEIQRLKEKYNDKKIINSSNHILSYKQEEYKEIQ